MMVTEYLRRGAIGSACADRAVWLVSLLVLSFLRPVLQSLGMYWNYPRTVPGEEQRAGSGDNSSGG